MVSSGGSLGNGISINTVSCMISCWCLRFDVSCD